jgi:8-oxo-dGTP pyrophosphatase MutT (NUDIX family)
MEIKNRELHRIALTAIIHKDGKYLITKRSPDKKAFPNKWTVPGGGLEVDDYIDIEPTTKAGQWYYAIETALRREIKEEVNLEVDKPKYLLDLTFIRPDGVPVVVLSYYCNYSAGEVILDEDAVEYAWVSVDELENYDLIDGIADEIREVDEILNN